MLTFGIGQKMFLSFLANMVIFTLKYIVGLFHEMQRPHYEKNIKRFPAKKNGKIQK